MLNTTDFQQHYQQLSNEELLLVAADRQELTDDAVAALDVELTKRGLHRGQGVKLKRNVERITARDAVGHIGLSYRGWGKQFIGARNYVADETSGFEEFDSTLWLFVAFVPLVPLAGVHIRRRLQKKSVFWSFGNTGFTPVSLRDLDLLQVLATYAGACVELFVVVQLVRFIVLPALHTLLLH